MATTATFKFQHSHHNHTGASVRDEWYHNAFATPIIPMPNFWQTSGLSFEQPLQLEPELPEKVSHSSFIDPVSLYTVSSPGKDPTSLVGSDEHFEIYNNSNNSTNSTNSNNSNINRHTKRRKTSSTSRSSPKFVESSPCLQDTSGRHKSVTEPVRRERNRIAAAKCRAKSKVAEGDMKEMQRVQRERNRVLRAQFEELTNEILMLKHELLHHSDCSHPIIDKYFMREADKISRGFNTSPESSRSSISMRD